MDVYAGCVASDPSVDVVELAPKVRALLNAVMAIGSDLDLHGVLNRIVVSACELTDARYGALGVLGRHRSLSDFVTHGLADAERLAIGSLPSGLGILGRVIDHPVPLRLARIQDHPQSIGFPPHHPPMSTFLGVPVRIRGTIFGNLYLTEKAHGVEFTAEDVWMVEALAAAAGSVIEKARVYEQSERRRHWLEASAQIIELLQPTVLTTEALGQIAAQARRVSGANVVSVVHIVDESGVNVEVTAGPGGDEALDEAALHAMIKRFAAQVDLATRTGEVVMPTRADPTVLLVPLRSQLADHGVLFVLFLHDQRLEPEEVELLAAFADQASLALDRAQAVSNRSELAVLTDRDRIARDLHDLVIQRLFATGLQLQGALRLATSPDTRDRIETAVTDLDLTIRDIRSTIFELHHQQPDKSLYDDVSSLVAEYVSTLGFAPVMQTSGPIDDAVAAEIHEQLCAVLREALSNVARHARAAYALVTLDVRPAEIILTVTDDGVGMEEGVRESGLGNVRARARKLGGTVKVTPRQPRGTQVKWRVPRRP